jgi:hypothetical protein
MQGAASADYNRLTMLPRGRIQAHRPRGAHQGHGCHGRRYAGHQPSPAQYYYWADREFGREIVSLQNDHIAELCSKVPDRLRGIGLLRSSIRTSQLIK